MNHQRSLFLPSLIVAAMAAVFTVSVVHARPLTVPAGVLTQDEDWVTVEVEGRGETVKAAIQDAIANGLRKIVGEYVTTETVVENDEIVEDVVRSFMVGQQVKSEQVADPRLEGTLVVVAMRVSAEPREINARFEQTAASTAYMDGETLAAELEFAAENIEKQREVLVELTRDMPARLLVARLIDREGNPIDAGRIPKEDVRQLEDGSHVIALNIECYFDLASWYGMVEPRLREALSAVALRSAPMSLRIQYHNSEKYKNGWCYPALVNHPAFGGAGHYAWKKIEGSFASLGAIELGETLFLVSRSRDRQGASEVFDAYVLPAKLDCMDTAPVHYMRKRGRTAFSLNINLIDQSGNVLRSETLPLSSGLIKEVVNPGRSAGILRDAEIPLSGCVWGGVRPWPSIAGWKNGTVRDMGLDVVGNPKPYDRRVRVMSPRFVLTRDGRTSKGPLDYGAEGNDGYCDSGVYRIEIKLSPGQLGELGGVIFDPIMNANARMSGASDPDPREVVSGDLPGLNGGTGSVFLFGSAPLYDVSDPPEPGWRDGSRGGSNRAVAGSSRDSGARGSGSTRKPGRPSTAEPASFAKEYKSHLAMLKNYAGAGLCELAADNAGKCLRGVDDSITAADIYQCVQALAACRGDVAADERRLQACRLIVERFSDSREATLARMELGE